VPLEAGGFRLLTDPALGGRGEFRHSHAALMKASNPVLTAGEFGPVDAMLPSHDQRGVPTLVASR
jgi:L-ascorbate metabolism protein UlaG (beta-lactamase superfamily)